MYQNCYYQREKNLVHIWDDKLGYRTFPYSRYAYEKADRGEYTSLYGDKLTKIFKFKKNPDIITKKSDERTGRCRSSSITPSSFLK